MPIEEKIKEVNKKIDYILNEYGCHLQIRMEPQNWFSRKFSKRIKINAGILILPNQQAPVPQIPTPPK